MKKFFIKICKFFGFEIIDQNEFTSPTLDKELNEDLSILNKNSIVLPLGEVKITRKVKSILIVIRVNTEIEVWDQNKRRLFEQPKIEYSIRSVKSLINSINYSILFLFFSYELDITLFIVNNFFTFLFYIIFSIFFKRYLKSLDD